jgi:hypothetical protein
MEMTSQTFEMRVINDGNQIFQENGIVKRQIINKHFSPRAES